MTRSRWNLWLDAMLALDLTVEEHRLALAVARCTLGWDTPGEYLGEKLLRDTSRMHGRSFERARDGLIEKGALRHEPGTPGRGLEHRGYYALVLDPEEKPAQERAFAETRKARAGAGISEGKAETEMPAEKPAEKPAQERVRKDVGSKGRLVIKENKREDLGSLRGDGLRNFRPLAFDEHLIEQVAMGALSQAEALALYEQHRAGGS